MMERITATEDDLKDYMEDVEKDRIKPDSLPPCPRCHVESAFFTFHAYRDRIFYVLVAMMIHTVSCVLLRFMCPGCRKTFTYYPDFAIPYKRYTRQSIVEFSSAYTEDDAMSYEKAVMVDHEVPGYENDDRTLSPSTIHRWITTLSCYIRTCQEALKLINQKEALSSLHRDIAQLGVHGRKYRSERRRQALLSCRRLILLEANFEQAFGRSIFTKLAMNCFYS